MSGAEWPLVALLSRLVGSDLLNEALRNPETTARIVGVAVAIAAALPGVFLVLRGMALTSDAISHTALLGIVATFVVMTRILGLPADLSSPWLLIGATAAGVATVLLTEALARSGLMRGDAALGIVFPLLFALAILLIGLYAEDVHLDEDSVMVGEIGVAWADTRTHCFGACEDVVITSDDPRARFERRCTNCTSDGISPRDPRAEFVEVCVTCGRWDAAAAWGAGLIDERPEVVHWPRSITVTALAALVIVIAVFVFYKELKITTFDPALAAAQGFRPGVIRIALMVAVSFVAVASFNAVGSVLVIAFFIIPAATAYLLTDRLSVMLGLAALLGSVAAWFGYDVAGGRLPFFGRAAGAGAAAGAEGAAGGFSTSISAAMVVVMLVIFVVVWIAAPRRGVIARRLRARRDDRQAHAVTDARARTTSPPARL